MGSRRSGRQGERGFTFIELMVVITIVALMATLVVTRMDDLSSKSRMSSSARQFGNEILRLREIAAAQAREMYLEIDLPKQRWRVIDVPSVNEVPDERDREELTVEHAWLRVPEGVKLVEIAYSRNEKITDDVVMLTFTERGELSPSGFVAFFSREEEEDEKGLSVEVSGLTGLVAYHSGRIEAEEVREEDDF